MYIPHISGDANESDSAAEEARAARAVQAAAQIRVPDSLVKAEPAPSPPPADGAATPGAPKPAHPAELTGAQAPTGPTAAGIPAAVVTGAVVPEAAAAGIPAAIVTAAVVPEAAAAGIPAPVVPEAAAAGIPAAVVPAAAPAVAKPPVKNEVPGAAPPGAKPLKGILKTADQDSLGNLLDSNSVAPEHCNACSLLCPKIACFMMFLCPN